ncbi:protein nrt1/ ptr family 5.5 [Phtheirospermum japonicum]|uniref:Protein nrt1/ ptr family 5.5 n=1 Tax=Phtheirospermum japonicum TaxID=374723 RepID=A0A830BWL6_9LAMI|nr:protein nrt1/ ptr family 5.5 [Phtheirospermum japonicum]
MRVIVWCANKLGFDVFSKAILFTSGLIFTHSLVEVALFSILITYLTSEWENHNLPKAAIVVNLHEGTYAVLQIAFAFLADAYTGLFKMVVWSTIFYIIGLGLFGVEYYGPLVLVTFSQAAIVATLKPFLDDQLLASAHQPITQEEEERANRRSDVCRDYVSMLGAIVAGFGLSHIHSFMTLAVVSAFAMGAALVWFLSGTKSYSRSKPTGSPLSDVAHVIYTAAVTKRKVEYPQTPDQLFQNSSSLVQISPHVSWLRWLDRAAVLVPQDQEEEPDNNNNTCTVEQVKGVKFLLKMLPMWSTFLTFSLVSATGSTFFLEEAARIDEGFSVIIFIVLQRFTKLVVTEICDRFLEKFGEKMNIEQKVMLVRICLGMICCVACCIAAWINAHHWIHLVKTHTKPEERHMSVFRLTPQYILLGVMEGFSADGLENFFDSQVSKSTARYGPMFGECVQGIGKFLSAVCILILTIRFGWFKDEIDSSRLDKYYAMLAILSSVNMIIYCFIAHWYGDERFLEEDGDDQVDVEMGNSAQADNSLPLLNLNTGRETENRKRDDDDNETEIPVHDVSSNAPLLSGARSFSRPSSNGIHKRFYSMR